MYIDKFEDQEYKIYTTQELQDLDPTVEDLEYFIESPALYLSLTVNMFKFCGYSFDDAEILKICRTNPDFYKEYTWTKEQRAEYEHIWVPIFMKCLDKDVYEAFYEIQTWNAMGTAFNLEDYSEKYYNEYLELVKDLNVATNNVHVVNVN